MKLRTKFMLAVGFLLFLLSIFDIIYGIKKERDIVRNDIKKWSFLFAENVRISLNTLMREDKMDMRFSIFDGLTNEIEGLANVRVIRSKKVDEIFKIANEKDVIPKEKRRIEMLKSDIEDLQDDLKNASDRDERDDINSEIASLKDGIAKSEIVISEAMKPPKIDKREAPQDPLDQQVLDTGETVYNIENGYARVIIPYKVKKKGCSETSGCHKYAKEGDVLGGINLEFSLAEVEAEIASHNRNTAIFGIVRLAVILLFILVILTLSITKPVSKVALMLKNIADGKGDLTRRMEVSSKDEVGLLSLWFNTFMEGMRDLVVDIISTSKQVSAVSEEVRSASMELRSSSEAQLEKIEETSTSIQEMNSTIKSIAYETDEQLKSTEDVSASVLEMLSSIAEVAENADNLSLASTRTSSSISEIAATLTEVATHVDSLFLKTEEVVSAATEINAAVREVTEHAKEKAVLAEKVRENASSLGLNAVRKTGQGMEKIKDEVSATASIIDRLEQRSVEIDRIVGVIQEITETTNLLSLNAAIIAAQAGEHGKGFAVVADEVKNLAKKTALSTKEIAKLISMVQAEVGAAKKSMINSSKSVDEGVKLSKEAGSALATIIESAESSFNMAKKVEIATYEQTNVLGQVTKAISEINVMVGEIKRATDEQKVASGDILKVTEDMRDATQVVRRSTQAQSRESDNITRIITGVAEKMRKIAIATAEQNKASEIIVSAIEMMKDEIEKNVSMAENLDSNIRDLDKKQSHLQERVESFKV